MLTVVHDKSVLRVTLSRPNVKNALDSALIEEIIELFEKKMSALNSTLRSVVISGQGSAFCAGADIQMMQQMAKQSREQNLLEAQKLHQLFLAIKRSPFPVICRVHGAVFGGGLGLAAASDIVISEEKTKFCFSEVNLGLAPAVISQFIRLRCGRLADPWMISGQVFSSQDACRIGLVDQVSTPELMDEVESKWTSCFENAGPGAVRATKELLDETRSPAWVQRAEITTKTIADLRVGAEGQEGLKAFLEKREPSWRGS